MRFFPGRGESGTRRGPVPGSRCRSRGAGKKPARRSVMPKSFGKSFSRLTQPAWIAKPVTTRVRRRLWEQPRSTPNNWSRWRASWQTQAQWSCRWLPRRHRGVTRRLRRLVRDIDFQEHHCSRGGHSGGNDHAAGPPTRSIRGRSINIVCAITRSTSWLRQPSSIDAHTSKEDTLGHARLRVL